MSTDHWAAFGPRGGRGSFAAGVVEAVQDVVEVLLEQVPVDVVGDAGMAELLLDTLGVGARSDE